MKDRIQSGADGQLSPKPTFRLKVCNGTGCTSAMQRLLSFAKGRYADVNFRLLDRRTRVVDIEQSSATCRRSRPAASGQINIATDILDAPAV
jgi:hypothetical protein